MWWTMNGFLAVDWLTLVCSFVFVPPVVSLTASVSATADPSAIADLIEFMVTGNLLNTDKLFLKISTF